MSASRTAAWVVAWAVTVYVASKCGVGEIVFFLSVVLAVRGDGREGLAPCHV